MVGQQNTYLLTLLPTLGGFGTQPPVGPSELLEMSDGMPRAQRLIRAIFLGDDLLLREAVLAGEVDQPEPVVLTEEQVRDQAPLPEVFQEEQQTGATRRIAADVLWESYYRYLDRVAAETGNSFLRDWVGFEVGLRNALASQRAKTLNLDPLGYLVAQELTESDLSPYDSVLGEWSAAPDPLTALKALDRARWQWMQDHDAWFSFSDDEIAAYATKLMLLMRWNRLESAQTSQTGPVDATA